MKEKKGGNKEKENIFINMKKKKMFVVRYYQSNI